MGTLVCFHAHPDDESIGTGGTMAKAAAAGHRVVLVVATGGECGEVPDDLAPGETLLARRRAETMRSAGADVETAVYDGAPHSFFDRAFGEWADACADAWRRILAFTDRVAERTP